MAHKRTLKHKQRKSPPLLEVVDRLINRGLEALRTGKIKASISDLIRMYRLQQKLLPAKPAPRPPKWVDNRR
jgi:hypothetical protein